MFWTKSWWQIIFFVLKHSPNKFLLNNINNKIEGPDSNNAAFMLLLEPQNKETKDSATNKSRTYLSYSQPRYYNNYAS